MKSWADMLSRVTLISAFLVAALVSSEPFQGNDKFRAISAVILGCMAVVVAAKKRQFTIAALALVAPWIDILLMFLAFGIFGIRVNLGI
ncbi:hypothetical protein [Corynebacterium hindlerae]|uniref:hypothetical protein n=1 Tax=Corynebacterium hindlerae TaxID=699041 RepID=UPI003AB00E87